MMYVVFIIDYICHLMNESKNQIFAYINYRMMYIKNHHKLIYHKVCSNSLTIQTVYNTKNRSCNDEKEITTKLLSKTTDSASKTYNQN